MNPIVESFHIDAGLFFAQVINFAIVLAVLYFFVVKPLMSVLEERTKNVEKGIADAKEADERLKKAQEDYDAKLAEAKKEAHALLVETKEHAERERERSVAALKEELEKEAEKERTRIIKEREDLLVQVRKETANLVVLSLEKVLGKAVSPEMQKTLVNNVVEISNHAGNDDQGSRSENPR